MLETKLFELRDRGTFIPAIATRMCVLLDGKWSEELNEDYFLARAGYGNEGFSILLTDLQGGRQACCDEYDWNDLTWKTAHRYIEVHWNELQSGEVIDVEFILGESKEKKVSERLESAHA